MSAVSHQQQLDQDDQFDLPPATEEQQQQEQQLSSDEAPDDWELEPSEVRATPAPAAPAPASAAAAFGSSKELTDLSLDLADATGSTAAGSKSQATLTECSHATLPEVGELAQDRVKLLLCACLVLAHSIALTVLDVIMMRRRCSVMLGGSFAVLAASLAVSVATSLLAFVRLFGRRAIVCVVGVWIGNLIMDVAWICLTFPRLDVVNCLGIGMMGVTAVGLVSCPATLVAFVIMRGWYKTKPSG